MNVIKDTMAERGFVYTAANESYWARRFSGGSNGRILLLACCRFRGHEDKIVTKETEIGHGETEVHEGVQV